MINKLKPIVNILSNLTEKQYKSMVIERKAIKTGVTEDGWLIVKACKEIKLTVVFRDL